MEELARKLMAWIGEQVSAANAKGVVVGLSGGLDSSVVAVLCKSASPHATLGVILPCHSSRRDIEDAEEIATKFDIPTQTIVLDEVFDLLLTKLPTQGFGPMAQPEG